MPSAWSWAFQPFFPLVRMNFAIDKSIVGDLNIHFSITYGMRRQKISTCKEDIINHLDLIYIYKHPIQQRPNILSIQVHNNINKDRWYSGPESKFQ